VEARAPQPGGEEVELGELEVGDGGHGPLFSNM
jgi:hypothetical protein